MCDMHAVEPPVYSNPFKRNARLGPYITRTCANKMARGQGMRHIGFDPLRSCGRSPKAEETAISSLKGTRPSTDEHVLATEAVHNRHTGNCFTPVQIQLRSGPMCVDALPPFAHVRPLK